MGYRLVPSFLAASPEEVVFPDAFVSKTHTEVAQDQQPAPARACTRAARVLLGVLLLAGLSLSPLRAQTVTFQGLITTVAGNGALGYSGDGGAATSAKLNVPSGVAVDGVGNLYIADAGNNRIRRVAPDGIITTVAGNGALGYSGDGGAATSAKLATPRDVALDGNGNLYIADSGSNSIRMVTPGGIITTVAGRGSGCAGQTDSVGDGCPATSAQLNGAEGIAVDGSGNLYIADRNNSRIRIVTPDRIITTVAGNGTAGYSGDGGAATGAEVNRPYGVAVDGSGNLYISDQNNQYIRKVDTSGIITTIAGNGTASYNGDNIAATSAAVNYPYDLAVDGAGNLYIADYENNRIRRVAPDGIITTVAGTGIYGYDGDNIPATSAELNSPAGVAVDGAGNLYIADEANDRIRKVGTGVGPQCTTSNPNPNPNPASFAAVGDFNGDCKSDILWRNNTTQQVYEWFMNGTTYSGSGSPGSPTSDWVIQSAGDFDGDGKADILWRNSTTGQVFIWLMNGSTIASSGSLGYVSSDWSIAGVGDFNGDGKADILWRNSTTGQVYLWLINGTAMSGGGSVTYISSDWVIQSIGDFNGDGMADILWRNSTTGEVYIWLMSGATLTTSGSLGSVSSDWSIQGVGDFDGDGKSDILWRNSTTGQVYLWFINGTAMSGGGSVSYVSSPWVIQGAGDYDGSGRAGILWRNTSTEQVYIWLMNGATLTSSGSPGAPVAAWQIAP